MDEQHRKAVERTAPGPTPTVPVPARLGERPRWGRFPIPYVTAVKDGRPDFSSHDHAARRRCAEQELCQLCGQSLVGELIAFVGFRWAIERNRFGEPPMHEDCMEFAWKACPWLASGRQWRTEFPEGVEQIGRRPEGIPEMMAVVIARAYTFEQDDAPRARGRDVLIWRPVHIIRTDLRRRAGA